MTKLIQVYRTLPIELFRVNNGPTIHLREWSPSRRIYDVVSSHGWVKAKALSPATYKAPNGASLRPNSPYQQYLVSRLFQGNDVLIYALPAGTQIPWDLLQVHERADHYSLQPGRDMHIQDLNYLITRFLADSGCLYTKEEWLHAYPRPTHFL